MDGYLPHEKEDGLFAHLDACPGCRGYYDDICYIYESMENPETEPPYGFSQRWREAVGQRVNGRRRTNFKVLIPAVAACVCGLLVVTTVFGRSGSFFSAIAEAPAAEVMHIEVRESADTQPEAYIAQEATQPEAQMAQGGLLEQQTVEGGADDASGAENSMAQNEIASAAPSAVPQQQAPQAAGVSQAAGVMEPVHTVDATGQGFRAELIGYARQQQGVEVTEYEDGRVALTGEEVLLNNVLAQFDLGTVSGTNQVEILF
jgi:hypothetical protein